jgi:hypothetical protein
MQPYYQAALLATPSKGSRVIPYHLDFTNVAVIQQDITEEILASEIDFIQSIYIDNSLNASTISFRFTGPLTQGYFITAQPFTQGWYPVCVPKGKITFAANTTQGIAIDIQLVNVAMPYFTWGPLPGVLVAPALANKAFKLLPCINGDNQLVAGVLAQTVKFYRGIFSVDNPAVLSFTDGPGGALLFAASLTAGGSVAFQVSGVPWFVASAGNALILNTTAAVNLYGGIGYVQS